MTFDFGTLTPQEHRKVSEIISIIATITFLSAIIIGLAVYCS